MTEFLNRYPHPCNCIGYAVGAGTDPPLTAGGAERPLSFFGGTADALVLLLATHCFLPCDLKVTGERDFMPVQNVSIRIRGTDCHSHVVCPSGQGPWPAVIFYGDAGGMRPAMVQMGERLADAGYVVLVPDLYYRFGPYAPLVPAEVFKGDVMAVLGPLMATTGTDKAADDAAALVAYLDTRDDVVGPRIGAVGFCMGAGLAIAAAASLPDRIAGVASFHGGNLATDASTSPHRFVARLAAEVYVASARDDDSYPPSMAARLEEALTTAGVKFVAEEYPAAHGWMVPDFPTYEGDSADRGWRALSGLLGRALRDELAEPNAT